MTAETVLQTRELSPQSYCGDYGESVRKITLAKGKLKSSSKLVKVKTSTDLSCVTICNHRNHVLS